VAVTEKKIITIYDAFHTRQQAKYYYILC